MNRSDLVRLVSRKRQLPQPQIETMLDLFLETILETLTSGESVSIRNFGKFEVRERKATVRKNPMTGDEIKVPAKRAVLFHPAPALKDEINDV
jgi:DNA-binding protein HU-beta